MIMHSLICAGCSASLALWQTCMQAGVSITISLRIVFLLIFSTFIIWLERIKIIMSSTHMYLWKKLYHKVTHYNRKTCWMPLYMPMSTTLPHADYAIITLRWRMQAINTNLFYHKTRINKFQMKPRLNESVLAFHNAPVWWKDWQMHWWTTLWRSAEIAVCLKHVWSKQWKTSYLVCRVCCLTFRCFLHLCTPVSHVKVWKTEV